MDDLCEKGGRGVEPVDGTVLGWGSWGGMGVGWGGGETLTLLGDVVPPLGHVSARESGQQAAGGPRTREGIRARDRQLPASERWGVCCGSKLVEQDVPCHSWHW